jgi:hypothetical protein
MKFTQDGKHVLTIGEPGVNNGSNDPDHLGGPANFYVGAEDQRDLHRRRLHQQARGRLRRGTGAYKRHWGAYGKRPTTPRSTNIRCA